MSFIFQRIKDKYYSIKNGIWNIIRWFPVIWKDRDWDYYYIFALLYHKFSNMEKFFRSDNAYSANALDVADKIRVAKLLCKRIIDDNYVDNALMPVEEKYGELKYHFEPTNNEKLKAMVFDEFPEERKARSKAYEHAEYMEKQDRKMLFTMLDKYIDGWWD